MVAIFPLIRGDPEFRNILKELQPSEIESSVNEAIQVLMHKDSLGGTGALFMPETPVVISIFQQWIIRYMCKKMLQIMTPEGLAMHYKNIPQSYREVYLNSQEHFCLKDIVSFHMKLLEENTSIVVELQDARYTLFCKKKVLLFFLLNSSISTGAIRLFSVHFVI